MTLRIVCGWTFTVHRTNAPPLTLLLALHALIGGEKSRVARTKDGLCIPSSKP